MIQRKQKRLILKNTNVQKVRKLFTREMPEALQLQRGTVVQSLHNFHYFGLVAWSVSSRLHYTSWGKVIKLSIS